MGSISIFYCGIGGGIGVGACLASDGGYFHTVDASRAW